MQFSSKSPHYEYLRKKWTSRHKSSTQNLLDKHLRHIALGSLGGLMILPISGLNIHSPHVLVDASGLTASKDTNKLLAAELKGIVPQDPRVLTTDEEKNISGLLTKRLGISVKAEVNGIRLNRSYGLIGAEQHLYRYPGDTIYDHAKDARDWAMFGDAGMAPGLGAWGYFAPSKDQLTPADEQKEKYYIAVQTFLAPGFAEHVSQYRDFFKYRKMVVVNPDTGQTVIADIADAGPAEWTGKQLGGSPEVMDALGLGSGPRKGAVLYFFIEDPGNNIPLGPIKIPESRES